jgi:ABC-2 type transport system ATP-binding protein
MPRVARACALLLALATLAAPAAAAAAPKKTTHRVPVTQPDEAGEPVELDVDVYEPSGPAPAGGFPLVVVFHGGGSDKDNGFDAGHAAAYAEHGYASLIYSARGHGGSSGQTTVAGPKEVRDGFDVIAWALARPELHLDRRTIALAGYSQGGLHVNLLQAYASDRSLNPYGIRFAALEPGNTPDRVFEALVDHDVVKLSFGLGLLQTYFAGAGPHRVGPQVDRWIATTVADRPELYGGDLCDQAGHDTPEATMRADLASRSIGCMADRMTPPTYWMQAFDDDLFPAGMATSMFDRALATEPRSRLYLSMGGHAAPAAPRAVEQEKTDLQIAWFDHVLRGAPFKVPRVVYWSRDTATAVPGGATAWPDAAFKRRTAPSWPPPGMEGRQFGLAADGSAAAPPASAAAGAIELNAPAEDLRNDPVAGAAFRATPLGTAPSGPAPEETQPGRVAVFATAPLAEATELSGAPAMTVAWTPHSTDSQLVLKVLAQAPDGKLTLLTRGVAGVRGAQASTEQTVTVTAQHASALLPAGARLVAWVTAGDASFYKAYPGSAGGTLAAGPRSVLTLPLRPAAAGANVSAGQDCTDRRAPVSRIRRAAVRRGRVTVEGTSTDRTCQGEPARKVARVFVAVWRPEGRRCRFVTPEGRLTRARSCRRRVWLEPSGASRWKLSVRARRLPAGRYRVLVQAADVRGNVERPGRRNQRQITVT